MSGKDLLDLRRDLRLTQEEARVAAGIVNRGTLVEIERKRLELSQEEYQRIASSYHQASKNKNASREEVTA